LLTQHTTQKKIHESKGRTRVDIQLMFRSLLLLIGRERRVRRREEEGGKEKRSDVWR